MPATATSEEMSHHHHQQWRHNRHPSPGGSVSSSSSTATPRRLRSAHSPTRSSSTAQSAPQSPHSIRNDTVLKAWTRIFETAAHEMFCLCEADLTRGQDDNTDLDAPSTHNSHSDFDSSSSSRDGLGPSPEETRARRDSAAIRRTKVGCLATKL